MATRDAEKPVISVGPWPKGMDTRSPAYAVPADAVRNAVDVDLGTDGRLRRRRGYTRIVDMPGAHSLWSCPVGTYFGAGGKLYRLNDNNTTTVLISGLAGSRIAFEYFNNDVYLSDNVVTYKLVGGSVVSPWGLPVPGNPPVLLPTSGSMAPGAFAAAVSFKDTNGQESGLSTLAYLSYANGGVTLTGFPSSSSSAVTHLRLYLTTPGGSTLYNVADVAVGTASYTVSAVSDSGKTGDTTRFVTPPAGSIIRHHAGRLFIASGNNVWFTEPFDFGKVAPNRNYIAFTEPVTVLEPAGGGIWIVADKTYYCRGDDPEKFSLDEALDYGAVPYTSVRLPHGEGVSWHSERGRIMGSEDGNAKNVQEERVAIGGAASGAAVLREEDGVRHIITVLSEARPNSLTATDFMEAEIIRPR